jgi:hypothetical protein
MSAPINIPLSRRPRPDRRRRRAFAFAAAGARSPCRHRCAFALPPLRVRHTAAARSPCRRRCAFAFAFTLVQIFKPARIEPDGSPLHQVSTGSSLNVHQAPALPTAPSARTGVPVKHAKGLHSSSEDDDEPQQLVSCGFESCDTMAAMCIEQRRISSKISSICFSLYLSSHCGPLQCPGPPRSRLHPSKATRSQVCLSISAWAAYTTQLILHAVSC